MARIVPVGIVNCTPDSFSDGLGPLVDPETGDRSVSTSALLDKAQALVDAGAEVLDIGGDSTRPGSNCPPLEEEWRRIEPLLSHFSHKMPVSVDTHKAEIARRAIECGAAMINDITGGIHSQLVDVVADSSVLYTYMFNTYGDAHNFTSALHHLTPSDAPAVISAWAQERATFLEQRGISLDRQVLDTGMGGFVSPDPQVSLAIIDRYWEITSPCTSRLLGCSRKGFLKQPGELSPADRDAITAEIGARLSQMAPLGSTLYLRVHNVARQLEAVAGRGSDTSV